MSRVYSLKAIQIINTTLDEAWNFFSRAENLASITPATMGFKIKSTHQDKTMYAGQVIEYTVKPLLGIPVYWMTEITHVQPQQYFIDDQRFGPYSLWHHEHHFKQIDNGIKMTDIVHYKIPFWVIGDAANALLVRRKLKKIFEFRYRSIEKKYGVSVNNKCNIEFS